MIKKQKLEFTWIGKENRPKLALEEHDVGGLLGDAGDKAKKRNGYPDPEK